MDTYKYTSKINPTEEDIIQMDKALQEYIDTDVKKLNSLVELMKTKCKDNHKKYFECYDVLTKLRRFLTEEQINLGVNW